MTKPKSRVVFSALASFALCITLLVVSAFWGDETETFKTVQEYSTKLLSDETVNIVTAEGSDYAIIFSSDTRQSDQVLASDLSLVIRSGCGVNIRYKTDVSSAEQKYEILIGDTNRAFSVELLEAINTYGSSSEFLVWGYAYKDGKLAFTANSDDAFSYGSKDFLALVSVDGTLSIPSDLFVIKYITRAEYEEYLRLEEEKKKQEYFDSLVEMNDAFTDDQFNTDKLSGEFYSPMVGENGHYRENPYEDPWVYPIEGDHPRYLVNDSILKQLAEILESGKSSESFYYNIVKDFWYYADANEKMHLYGEFPSVKGASGEYYRYDSEILTMIEAKALAYLLTGDELYAYEAIVCVKNAILTLHWTKDLHGDTYHGASNVMMVVAAVYDWCYDVLSENDKWQLIWGVAQILGPQMESFAKYPVSTGLQGVNSHQTGPQILRDWMTISSVVADEAPDWWDVVGGAYFSLYLPIVNEQFKSGWCSSGTIIYGQSKAQHQAWAAYVVKMATGESFLTADGAYVMNFWMSHSMDGQYMFFETGDGFAHAEGASSSWEPYLVFAALYNDPVTLAQAAYFSDDFAKRVAATNHTYFSLVDMLCLISAVDYNGEERLDGVDTIQYFAYPASQMTAREVWDDPDSISVFMKIGNITMSDHDIYDHGTFQIYYKGLLAGTSGPYNYGTDSYFYYRKATVASNGLLVFNPSKAEAEYTGNNASRYYYSGGQLHKQVETSSLEAWLASGQMAETIGAAYGFNNDGSSKYAYLAGNLTQAYDDDTVEYIGRKMFTLFTGDEDFPVLFFTFDQITSDDASFTKHWLLHTLKEPTIDQDNLTATVINGEGKMYLESLYGADSIVKIGGEGKAWWINGYFTDPNNKGSWNAKTQDFDDPENKGSWVEGKANNDENAYNGTMNYEKIWGRIELRTEGSEYSKFFTVMAITDTENETAFEIEKFKNDDDTVYGAKFGNSIVTFLNSEDKPGVKQYKEFSFTTEGKGLYEYYIAGIEAGTWQVFVDGVSVAFSLAEEDGALLTFVAPAGEVTLEPGKDVIGDNGGKIQYITGGANMPDGTPYSYNNEVATPLPTENIVRGKDRFGGWYTSPDYKPETAITEIPVGTNGTVKLYAKWILNFTDEDYSKTILKTESGATIGGVRYFGKTGCSFTTKTDENGVNYLEWIEGPSDPMIIQTSATRNLSAVTIDDLCVSYTFKLALEEGATPMKTYINIPVKQDVNGNSISSDFVFLRTDDQGNVTTYDGSRLATLSTDKVTSIRFVIDFKLGEIRYYDDNYNAVIVNDFAIPSKTQAENHEELLKCITEYVFRFYGDSPSNISDAALRVYGIRVQEGDEFIPLQTEGIKYNLNGGKLPNDAVRAFNEDGSITALPTKVTREGYVFAGWYTTPDFAAGTETSYAPEGSSGVYEVYARWNRVVINEDYTDSTVDSTAATVTVNGITYNGEGKSGASFKTESANGKNYLVWTAGENDSSISVANDSTSVPSTVSYTVTLGKNGAAELPDLELGLSGEADSNIIIARLVGGNITLGASETSIATVGDDAVTVRIVIDFNEGTVTVYDEWGRTVAEEELAESSGVATALELKENFKDELLYIRRINASSGKASQSVRIYNIKVDDGNTLEAKNAEEIKPNSIIYETNGGALLGEVPNEYDVTLGTILPTNVIRDGYVFGGWYTDSRLSGERIKYIPAGSENPVKVYAKWSFIAIDENYETTVVTGANKFNGIQYGNNSNASFAMGEDGGGNKYLSVVLDSASNVAAQANILVKDNGVIISSSVVCYEMSFAKIVGVDLTPTIELQLPLVNGGSSSTIFKVTTLADGTGEIKLNGGSKVIGTITEGVFDKIRIAVDFDNKTVTAYDDNYDVIDTVTISALPDLSAIDRQYHMFLYTRKSGSSEFGKTGYLLDDIRIVEGMIFDKPMTELPKATSIKYEMGDGTLPNSAPTEYDPITGTILPIPTKNGYKFGGWYTTSTFDNGTDVNIIMPGTEGMITLYAKWLRVVVAENYESTQISNAGLINGVKYNNNANISYATVDENGNKYLSVTFNSAAGTNAQGSITVNDLGSIKDCNDSVISYEMSFSKPVGIPLPPTLELQLPLVSGGASPTIFKLAVLDDGTGEIYLNGGSKAIATVKEGEFCKLRVAVDFATKTATAYDENFEVIDRVTISTIPNKSEINRQYHMFLYLRKAPSANIGTAGLLFDDLKVEEGLIFKNDTEEPTLPKNNTIVYEANGGTLPEGAPTEYDRETETVLPTPIKSNSLFAGWYTTSTFDEGTRVEKIAAGTKGTVQLYARWYFVAANENYQTTVVTGANKFNGIQYANNSNANFAMGTDDSGNKYLSVVLDSDSKVAAQANILVKDNGVIISSSVVCYEMSFAKIAGVDLTPIIELQLPLVNGVNSSTIFKVTTLADGTGEIKLNGGSKVIGTIKEGVFDKIRIAVDFDNKTATAYDDNYDVIDTVTISALPNLSAINRQYHMFLYTRKPGDSVLGKTGYLLDDIKIVEGNIYEK